MCARGPRDLARRSTLTCRPELADPSAHAPPCAPTHLEQVAAWICRRVHAAERRKPHARRRRARACGCHLSSLRVPPCCSQLAAAPRPRPPLPPPPPPCLRTAPVRQLGANSHSRAAEIHAGRAAEARQAAAGCATLSSRAALPSPCAPRRAHARTRTHARARTRSLARCAPSPPSSALRACTTHSPSAACLAPAECPWKGERATHFSSD